MPPFFLTNEKPARVLVIGDIMLDHYILGKCERISPEAPVPVVEMTSEYYTLGGAGNVLKNLTALGADAGIISAVGDDGAAKLIDEALSECETGNNLIVRCRDRVTTVKTRVLAVKHQLLRLDRESRVGISKDTEDMILRNLKSCISEYDVVLISDYLKGVLTERLIGLIASECNKYKVRTIADPKAKDFSRYKGIDIIKPNRLEAKQATGIEITDEESLRAACEKIVQITGCRAVVITLSEDGIAYYEGGILAQIPTKAVEVYDVTGAGDTVLAALGFAIAKNAELHEACDFANHAAALVVRKVGSATASLDEILRGATALETA